MRRFHALWVAWVLLGSATAFAQSGGSQQAREQASLRFQRGVELFQDEAYRAALIEFERAYEIQPDYRLLYNIGRTKVELQDYLGAAQAYEGYLAGGGQEIPAARRAEVEQILRALRERVGRISITVNRDGADVFIDDNKVGQSPITGTISVNVGRHRVAVRAPDGSNDAQLVDVAAEEIAEVSITLAPPKLEMPLAGPAEQRVPLRKFAIIGWSAGGALLLGALATGMLAMHENRNLDDLLKEVDVEVDRDSEQRDKVKAYAMATDVLVATGAVLAVAGTTLWLIDRRASRKADEEDKQKSAKLDVDVGLGTLTLRGSF